jgi:hypothetical protein
LKLDRLDGVAVIAILALATGLIHLVVFPVVGVLQDDGQYAAYGWGLADGLGYVNPARPEHPPASRYPIGFPALLALLLAVAPDRLAALQWVPAAAAAAFLALTYIYLRGRGSWSRPAALAAVVALGLNHRLLTLGSFLWSDLVFASVALGALLLMQRAATWRAWAAAGLVTAAAWLVRYAGGALVLAAAAVLGWQRRWRELGALLAPQLLIALAWFGYRARTGGEDYAQAFTTFLGGPAELPGRLANALGALVGGTLPGLLLPGAPAWLGPLVLVVAGLGLWRGDRLAAAYVVATAALAVAYALPYQWYGDELTTRLFIPAWPCLLVALGLALPRRRDLQAVLLALALVAGGFDAFRLAQRPPLPWWTAESPADFKAAFAFIHANLPPDGRLLSPYPDMIYLYTGRPGGGLPVSADAHGRPVPVAPAQLRDLIVAKGVTHLVGLPGRFEGKDLTVATLNAFGKAYPGALVPIYLNQRQTAVVFQVDPAAL